MVNFKTLWINKFKDKSDENSIVNNFRYPLYLHFRKPQRNHMETEVVCSIPHKVSLLATGAQDNTAKHPKKGVSLRKVYKDSQFLGIMTIFI